TADRRVDDHVDQGHAVAGVAELRRAGCVDADLVALHVRPVAVQNDTVAPVAGDHVVLHGVGEGVVEGVGNVDAVASVADRRGAGGVGPDQVAAHRHVPGRGGIGDV